jgi:hypothetical protein
VLAWQAADPGFSPQYHEKEPKVESGIGLQRLGRRRDELDRRKKGTFVQSDDYR